MIHLVPMTETDFQIYYDQAVAEYAEEHIKSGSWSEEEAYENSKRQYQDLLPDGVATPNQYLYTLTDATTQTPVGILWFALQSQAGQKTAFIYDIAIDPAFRRKGYATQALTALEEKVRSDGVQQVRLHVFGHNQGAQALYERLGYVATNILMAKSLEP